MSFFSGLNAESYDRQYSDRELLVRIARYFRPQRRALVVIALTLLVNSGMVALLPVVVSHSIDLLKPQMDILAVYLLSGAILLIGLVRWCSNWILRRVSSRAIADVVLSLAQDAFQAATGHDLSFYDEYSSGRILSRITGDTRDFGQLISLTTDLVAQVAEALILGVVLVNIEWRLCLYIFALIPIVLLLSISYRRLARTVTRRGMQAMAEVNATIKETVSG
ncbi:MAG: ABC transporter ATP-binding protein, partial [Anaerolineaceae bacterium]|nr:ABC transporter ATP-binding protein [Anaerolineaceae bacterium]